MPDRFPSRPGSVFAAYLLLASIAEFAPDAVFEAASTLPLEAEALVLGKESRRRILVANLRPVSRDVMLGPVSGRVRTSTIGSKAPAGAVPVSGEVRLTLGPYAVACVDIEPE